jgi:hypothetical protein
MSFYLHITDDHNNDNQKHIAKLKAKTHAEAKQEAQEYVLEAYIGEEYKDGHFADPTWHGFYHEKVTLVECTNEEEIDIDAILKIGDKLLKDHKQEQQEAKERAQLAALSKKYSK